MGAILPRGSDRDGSHMPDSTPPTECTIPQPGPSAEHDSGSDEPEVPCGECRQSAGRCCSASLNIRSARGEIGRMRKDFWFLIALSLLCLAGSAAAQTDPAWTEPFPPHHVIGNVYYVGSKGLASYLITTPQGHILINSSLRNLGSAHPGQRREARLSFQRHQDPADQPCPWRPLRGQRSDKRNDRRQILCDGRGRTGDRIGWPG